MYVISYDISNDRLRVKIAKLLEGYGRRVQYSVFESRVSEKQFQVLYSKLIKLTSGMENSTIMIYQICSHCEKKISTIGVKESHLLPEEEEIFVI